MLIELKTGLIIGVITYLTGITLRIIISKKLTILEQISYAILTIIVAFFVNSILFEYLYNINIVKDYVLQPQLYYFVNSVAKFKNIFSADIYALLLDAFKYQATIFVPTIIISVSGLIGVALLFISKKLLDRSYNIEISKVSVNVHGDTILIYSYMALIFFGTDLETVLLLKNIIYIVTILYFIQGCYVFDYLSQEVVSLTYRVSIYMVLVTMIILLPTMVVIAFPFSIFRIKELIEILITMIAVLGIVDSKVNIRRLG